MGWALAGSDGSSGIDGLRTEPVRTNALRTKLRRPCPIISLTLI